MSNPLMPSMPEPMRKPEPTHNPGSSLNPQSNSLMHGRATPYTERHYGKPGNTTPLSDNQHLEEVEVVPPPIIDDSPFGKFRRRDKLRAALKYNRKLRQELAKELRISPFQMGRPENVEKLNKAIKEIEGRIPRSFGNVVDERKLQSLRHPSASYREYWEEKRERRQKAEGGFTKKEVIDTKVRRKLISFFKRLWGLDKPKE